MNKEIAEKLGVELDALTQAFEGFKVFSNDDFEAFKTNLSGDSQELKEKYQAEGREVGTEIALKQLKEKLGLDYKGRKNLDNMVQAINDKIEADTQPSNGEAEEYKKKVSELSEALQSKSSEFESFRSEVAEKENNRVVVDALQSELNKFAGKTTLDISDLATLYRAKFQPSFDGDSIKVYQGNEIIKDDLLNPVTIQESVSNFVESSYLADNKPTGGRGKGDDAQGSGKMTIEKFEASLDKQGIAKNSSAYNERIVEAVNNGLIES
jgi:hypothetical protein